MTVQTQVSEADIGKLRIGMLVYFTTLGSQDYRWYSKLDRVEPTPSVTNNVVLYNALFEVPNESQVLRTQMSTQVFFIAARAKDVLLIPASALNFKPRKLGEAEVKVWGDKAVGDKIKSQVSTVQVMDPRGNLSERKIKYGVTNRVQVEVLEGLEEGEKIVIGMKPTQKNNATNQPLGQAGAAAGGARQMR